MCVCVFSEREREEGRDFVCTLTHIYNEEGGGLLRQSVLVRFFREKPPSKFANQPTDEPASHIVEFMVLSQHCACKGYKAKREMKQSKLHPSIYTRERPASCKSS